MLAFRALSAMTEALRQIFQPTKEKEEKTLPFENALKITQTSV